jgi:hypothetical protein
MMAAPPDHAIRWLVGQYSRPGGAIFGLSFLRSARLRYGAAAAGVLGGFLATMMTVPKYLWNSQLGGGMVIGNKYHEDRGGEQ